jgi:ankyrin repeat protein
LLLERGANPNTIDRKKLSPLYHAVWGQSNDSVKLLLAGGADEHFCDPHGHNLAEFARESHFYRQQYTIEDFWQRERRG